jgi:hypothetical protein
MQLEFHPEKKQHHSEAGRSSPYKSCLKSCKVLTTRPLYIATYFLKESLFALKLETFIY